MVREAGLLLVAVLGISFSAPLAAAAPVPALAIAFWRTAMASVVLAPVAVRAGRATARDVRTCALAGLLLAVHFGTWIPSLLLTSVATSTALVCTTPLWTAVLTRLAGGRIPPMVWTGGAVALAGVVLVAGVDVAGSPRALLGDALALVGGVAMAGYLLVGAAARARLATSTYTLLCYATAAVTLLVVVLVAGVPLAGWRPAGGSRWPRSRCAGSSWDTRCSTGRSARSGRRWSRWSRCSRCRVRRWWRRCGWGSGWPRRPSSASSCCWAGSRWWCTAGGPGEARLQPGCNPCRRWA